MSFSLPANSAFYYNLQASTNLFTTAPTAAGMTRDPFALTLNVPLNSPYRFFRAELISIFAPQDTDGDGIDDLYELDRPAILNPLNPTDASLDPDGNGLTHLQEYQLLYGYSSTPAQIFSHEASAFNFGAASAMYEAVTREVVAFNFGAASAGTEAVSAEVSVYNGDSPALTFILTAYSREVSTFNFGAAPASVEAISREVSFYRGEAPAPTFVLTALSPEVTAFNFGAASGNYEAISHEVSVRNYQPN